MVGTLYYYIDASVLKEKLTMRCYHGGDYVLVTLTLAVSFPEEAHSSNVGFSLSKNGQDFTHAHRAVDPPEISFYSAIA